jgi:flavodoxin
MENEKLNIIYFSPTEATKLVITSIADGIKFQIVKYVNLLKKDKIKKHKFSNDELIMIGVPVYSGRIPLTVIDRLRNFEADNAKVVLVVVYGNRHFDDALLELKDLTMELGFIPIAAGAFIGEHSFSSSEYHIAEERPNSKDIKFAKDFGKTIIEQIDNDSQEIKIPRNYPYKKDQRN